MEGAGSEPLGALTTTSTLIDLAIAGRSLFYNCQVMLEIFGQSLKCFCASRREQGQRPLSTEVHQAFVPVQAVRSIQQTHQRDAAGFICELLVIVSPQFRIHTDVTFL